MSLPPPSARLWENSPRSLTLDAYQLWDRTIDRMEGRVNSGKINFWLRPCLPLEFDGSTLTIAAPSPRAREWLARLSEPLHHAMAEAAGRPVRLVVTLSTARGG